MGKGECGIGEGMSDLTCFVAGLLMLASLTASCTGRDVEVVFYVSDGYTFSREEQQTIETLVQEAVRTTKPLLPELPTPLIVRVNPGQKVMEETGQTGTFSLPNVVYWNVDPTEFGGVEAIANRQLRSTLMHEPHHLVRASRLRTASIMDHVVSEGLATAFERDFGNAPTPWGTYPANTSEWLQELMALPPDAPRDQWLSRHPDGRRWIGYRAGTYLADRAMRASGKSAAELVSVSTAGILELAHAR